MKQTSVHSCLMLDVFIFPTASTSAFTSAFRLRRISLRRCLDVGHAAPPMAPVINHPNWAVNDSLKCLGKTRSVWDCHICRPIGVVDYTGHWSAYISSPIESKIYQQSRYATRWSTSRCQTIRCCECTVAGLPGSKSRGTEVDNFKETRSVCFPLFSSPSDVRNSKGPTKIASYGFEPIAS